MKKGFTLIELLAVIVILAIIALIATPIVLNIIKDTKESATIRSAENYISAVEQAVLKKNLYGKFNPSDCTIPQNGDGKTLDCVMSDGTRNTLTVEYNGIALKDGAKFVFYKGSVVKFSDLSIGGKKVLANSLNMGEAIEKICTAVTQSNATRVVNGLTSENLYPGIPKRDSSGDLLFTVGDEFICEVKENTKYHFFILSTNADGTLNLIMNNSVIGSVYASQADYAAAGGTFKTIGECTEGGFGCTGTDLGPITAIKSMKTITDTWERVPNLSKTYTNNGKNYTVSGKARIIEDVESAAIFTSSSNGTEGLKTWWLLTHHGVSYSSEYYFDSTNITSFDDTKMSNQGSLSYWQMDTTFTRITDSGFDSSISFYSSDYSLSFGSTYPGDNTSFGVRPVITLSKSQLQ